MAQDIDLIIPMVFPQDPAWQAEYKKYRGSKDATQHVRFRSWGTEELLVRCCMKYMPWVHCIFLVLASSSQEQEWMRKLKIKNGKLKIVFHKDFIPEEYLPCFSSPCFEMFLHRIPDLSECFIYGNDDMFPLSPLEPEDFFRLAGEPTGTVSALPCMRFSEKAYPDDPNVFQRKCMAQLNMIGKPFGKRYKNTYLKPSHSLAPITKSVCEEVWRQHGDEIIMHLSPLTRTDRSYNHYIYMLQAYFDGLSVGHTPREQYVGPKTPTARIAQIIADQNAGIVCLNDNEGIRNWEEMAAIVRAAIGKKLDIASQRDNNIAIYRDHNALRVAIVHYNTPRLTRCAIRSLWKHTPGVHVTVFDNSDLLPFMSKNAVFVQDNAPLIDVIDNTHGQIVNWEQWLQMFPDREPSPGNNYGSAKHCYSVQWLIDNSDAPFLLMDSDVLVKQDVTELFHHEDCAWVGELGENVRRRFGYDFQKVQPFLCWLNVPLLKDMGIRYFNAEWMWNLTRKKPNHRYDTGAWLHKAVSETCLPVYELSIGDYILHLGHGSWRDKSPMKWALAHRELWD